MAFSVPTLDQLKRLSSDTLVSALAQGQPVLRRKVEDAIGDTIGLMQYLSLERLLVVWEQIWPDTAGKRWLDRLAAIWDVTRKDRAPAQGKIQISGSNGSVLPASSVFQHPTLDIFYTTLDKAEIVGGQAFVYVRATTGGVDTNLPLTAEVTLTVAQAGIDGVAVVVVGDDGEAGLVGGVDIEDDEDLRARLLQRIRNPPAGGSIADYVRWALEVPGVTRAWCVPNYNGPGTVLVLIVDDTSNPITPPQPTIDAVAAYLVTQAPATDVPGITVGTPTLLVVGHDIVLSPNTAAVRAAVLDELDALYRRRDIGADIKLSQITGAIDRADGEDWNELQSPVADVVVATYEIPVIGTVNFLDPP